MPKDYIGNWVINDLTREIHRTQTPLPNSPIKPHHLAAMSILVKNGALTVLAAREIISEAFSIPVFQP
jgi:Asp-tRNA(Asn)/Glu-tRNA(Gln) amidotransferase B subunit